MSCAVDMCSSTCVAGVHTLLRGSHAHLAFVVVRQVLAVCCRQGRWVDVWVQLVRERLGGQVLQGHAGTHMRVDAVRQDLTHGEDLDACLAHDAAKLGVCLCVGVVNVCAGVPPPKAPALRRRG